MSQNQITTPTAPAGQNSERKSTQRTRRALAKAKRNGDFAFFCANADFSDADRIVAELRASGALKGIVE